MIVAKAVTMAEMMKVPMLGIGENMSYIVCPDCGKHINVFGNSHVDEVAAKHHLPVLAKCRHRTTEPAGDRWGTLPARAGDALRLSLIHISLLLVRNAAYGGQL